MTTLANIDLETGDTTQFTGIDDAGSNLSVTTGSKIHGSYGLNIAIVNTTAAVGYKDVAKDAAGYRFRIYLNTNSISIPDSTRVTILKISQKGGSYLGITYVDLYYYTATGYRLRFRAYNDAAGLALDSTFNITNGEHYIEISAVAAATLSSSDGSYQWWVDNSSKGSVASVDNFNRMTDQTQWRASVGSIENIGSSISGAVFFDDLFMTNTPSVSIGPVVTAVKVPIMNNSYRQRRS